MKSNNSFPWNTPEAQGISSSAILRFVEAAEKQFLNMNVHSFLLLRQGVVVAEGGWAPYTSKTPHIMNSLTKNFLSTAVGMAVAEGNFSLDAPVIEFFPEEFPEALNENIKRLQVRHLLTMSTGQVEDPFSFLFTRSVRHLHSIPPTSSTTGSQEPFNQSRHWVKEFFTKPLVHPPGTHFLYNNGASYLLSVIIQKTTGLNLLDYLEPRLLTPLGIKNLVGDKCPKGFNIGAWGMYATTEDVARLGQLYLQKGTWGGQQILSESWVAEATAYQINSKHQEGPDWAQGYGYQFWQCRHGVYRGDGAFGQFCVVLPQYQAVLAMTNCLGDLQALLNLVWEHLLPAFEAYPLPENLIEYEKLTTKLSRLMHTPAQGQYWTRLATEVSGKEYVFEENDLDLTKITFDFQDSHCMVTIGDDLGTHQFTCGHGEWFKGSTSYLYDLYNVDDQKKPCAVSGAWIDDTTYMIKLCYLESFGVTFYCQFLGNQLSLNCIPNLGEFLATVNLEGKMIAKFR